MKRRSFKQVQFVILVVAGLALFQNASSYLPYPRLPILQRDVHLMENTNFTKPIVPAFRTSADGRVAVRMKGNNTTGKRNLYLFRPESLSKPLAFNDPGVRLLASAPTDPTLPQEIELPNFVSEIQSAVGVLPGETEHVTLCDGTDQFLRRGVRRNPYSCGTNLVDDCYDLTLIASRRYTKDGQEYFQLFGLPLNVTVTHPKSNKAFISKLVKKPLQVGVPFKNGIQSFLEPMVTSDGQLLVARFESKQFSWSNSNTGATTLQNTDIGYFYGTNPGEPCDVTQWNRAYPLSHAQAHVPVRQNYGFARYPFRDSTGKLIPDGANFPATYPWIDRKGRNLFFATAHRSLFTCVDGKVVPEFPVTCLDGVTDCVDVPPTCDDIPKFEKMGNIKVFGMIGLWTHGKVVMLDGNLNPTDYGLGVLDRDQRNIELYKNDLGDSVSIRVGSSRETGNAWPADTKWPVGSSMNTTFIESFENLFNDVKNVKPLKQRDVVWTINTGRATEEVAFDDYLDPHFLIFSEMNTGLEYDEKSPTRIFNRPVHQPVVQNSATSPAGMLNLPKYGVVSGNVRIEPVALGGIHGKGLFLPGGSASVEYQIPQQSQSALVSPWYVGVFINPNGPLGSPVRLLSFPDGSHLDIENSTLLRVVASAGNEIARVALSVPLSATRWSHLALQLNSNTIKYYQNGMLIGTSARENSLQLTPGAFAVGGRVGASGFSGWIDEIKVTNDDPNIEVKCNHARGTIIGNPSGTQKNLKISAIASLYPPMSQNELKSGLQIDTSGYSELLCYTQYNVDGIDRPRIPTSTESLRQSYLFPEGPLRFNSPRPNSTGNKFCLSCHVSPYLDPRVPASLSLMALVPGTLSLEEDRRRQPMEALRLTRGFIPANYFGTGLPAGSLTDQPGLGHLRDAWIHPK